MTIYKGEYDICNWFSKSFSFMMSINKRNGRRKKRMKKNMSNIMWGIAFILIGLGIGGDILGIWNFDLFFDGWWTLFIIIPSIVSIVQKGPGFGNIVWLGIGVLILLGSQNLVNLDLVGDMIVPILLILFGASFIFKSNHYKKYNAEHMNQEYYSKNINVEYDSENDTYTDDNGFQEKRTYTETNKGSITNLTGIFSGRKASIINEVFNGGSLNAIFGGVTLDISNAIIDHDVYIDATAIFGGVDMFVPRDVKVVVSSTPIFGGVSNKVPQPIGNIRGTIYINAVCMFGGVDIK